MPLESMESSAGKISSSRLNRLRKEVPNDESKITSGATVPRMGATPRSGSSMIAAWNLGFEFTGIEIDPVYYKAAVNRFCQHIAQGRLL